MTDDGVIWDQRGDESAKQYDAFRAYLALSPLARSIAGLVAGGYKEYSQPGLYKYSQLFSWQQRAAAYDRFTGQQAMAKQQEDRIEVNTRYARLAKAGSAKLAQAIMNIDPDDLKPADIIRWVEGLQKVERLALGMPLQVEISGPDGGPIEVTAVPQMAAEDRRAILARAVSAAQERMAKISGDTILDGEVIEDAETPVRAEGEGEDPAGEAHP